MRKRLVALLNCDVCGEKTVHCETGMLSEVRCEVCGNNEHYYSTVDRVIYSRKDDEYIIRHLCVDEICKHFYRI